MRLGFMGTPDFAVPALEALIDAGHEIAAVYCQPPRPAGRGKRPRPSPVQSAAEARGIEVRHPASLRKEVDQQDFAALEPEIAVVAAYGLILPQPILDAPKRGCLNIHASLLPRWRGAAPIQRAIMAGDSETGVCIMAMEAGLDTGPVLLREAVPIEPDADAGALHDTLAALGARLIVETLGRIDGLVPVPQSAEGMTYAAKIDKAETRIDWARPAVEIERLVRAMAPTPGAWTEVGSERVKVLAASIETGSGAPGTALDDRLLVACGTGALRLKRLQRAGRAVLPAEEVLRGLDVPAGTQLG